MPRRDAVILLIDIGNTRIKWCEFAGGSMGTMHAASYAGWDRNAVQTQMLANLSEPERVLVANVGGAAIGRLLSDAIEAQWGLTPNFVESTAESAGVRNAYVIPKQLGVDRWSAVIGAFHLRQTAVCVVSVGTAMTIDSVDKDGKHLGGVIVPGPDLATKGLLKNTSELATRSQTGAVAHDLFADNTLGAIHQGITHMLAALVERALQETQRLLKTSPALVLTGGACARIAPALKTPHEIIPDLVLRGLAVLARQ